MSWFYHNLLRPALFAHDSEAIHDFTLRLLARSSHHPFWCEAAAAFYAAPALPTICSGLSFPNPIGLAAGMDKQAAAVPIWASLGFGFCELGGVTRHPQPGNPAPRMFRAVSDRALINRMGFNNPGADRMAQRLAEWRNSGQWPAHPVGINLGKSKITPLQQAPEDYAYSFRILHDYADFFVVNVSSPNTPNLRQLQDRAALDEILAALQSLQPNANPAPSDAAPDSNQRKHKPVFIKVAPDLSWDALDEILELVGPRQIAGIVATNTTVSRPENSNSSTQPTVYAEAGGLSGGPLKGRSTAVIRHLYRQSGGRVPIIGVGGIFDANDAWEKILAGASLLQLYTGLVYEGPAIVRTIVRGLRDRLQLAGIAELSEAVGRENMLRMPPG